MVCPEAGKVDTAFLKKFRAVILKYVKRGDRFAIIVGGGKLARVWQNALRAVALTTPGPSSKRRGKRLEEDLDWVGIRATQVNAELVRAMFGNAAYDKVVLNPQQKMAKFKILVGAGYVPGHSTDYDAVVRARSVGAKTVINLSNVQYVYNKDPRKFKNAQPLKKINWADYLRMVGKKYTPGMNAPFDPIASAVASRAGIRVVFMSGRDLKNFEHFLQGKAFRGTIIE